MNCSTHKKGQDNHTGGHDPGKDERKDKQTPARRNPRLVIGSLDYFDLIMEQDEQ